MLANVLVDAAGYGVTVAISPLPGDRCGGVRIRTLYDQSDGESTRNLTELKDVPGDLLAAILADRDEFVAGLVVWMMNRLGATIGSHDLAYYRLTARQ